MSLKPISGEIKAQVLNDNFSYINQKAEEGGTDPLLEQKVDDLIARIGNNQDLDTTEKSKIILAINEIHNDLAAHRAESVAKIALITEPYNQATKTTINLGFRPKLVNIEACIMNTKYESSGYSDGSLQFAKLKRPSLGTIEITGGAVISFYEGSNNYIQGSMVFTETGLEITWDIRGTLPEASGSRRFIISAMTHGEDV